MLLFASTYPISAVALWCRYLRHGLSAGLPLTQVFRTQARSGPSVLRPAAGRIASQLEQGESLEDALEGEKHMMPTLFVDLTSVGERTGRLPEVLRELEDYYDLLLRLRKKFIAEITWPAIQFVLAVLVVAFVIFILGFIAQTAGTKPIEPIGLGLSGASGALIFLAGVAAGLTGLFLLYRFVSRQVRYWAPVEAFLLRLPIVGPCVDALAMWRFCLGMSMTLEVGMSARSAFRRSVHATNNAAFIRESKKVLVALKSGADLHSSLSRADVFRSDFLDALAVAEETGQVPEVMQRLAKNYAEEASRRLSGLSQAAAMGVWAMVAIFIIIMIFQLAGIYLGALSGAGLALVGQGGRAG